MLLSRVYESFCFRFQVWLPGITSSCFSSVVPGMLKYMFFFSFYPSVTVEVFLVWSLSCNRQKHLLSFRQLIFTWISSCFVNVTNWEYIETCHHISKILLTLFSKFFRPKDCEEIISIKNLQTLIILELLLNKDTNFFQKLKFMVIL